MINCDEKFDPPKIITKTKCLDHSRILECIGEYKQVEDWEDHGKYEVCQERYCHHYYMSKGYNQAKREIRQAVIKAIEKEGRKK